ncbi:MAG: hypothetical protein EXS32_01000 [Opitutus sp.]|nr:hypothetical protein [Opitutus sp.]
MTTRSQSAKDFNPDKFLAQDFKKKSKINAGMWRPDKKQAEARRKFDQALRSMRASRDDKADALDSESQLAIAALTAYFGIEAFPMHSPFHLKLMLIDALPPDVPAEQHEPFVEKAIGIAVRFRKMSMT